MATRHAEKSSGAYRSARRYTRCGAGRSDRGCDRGYRRLEHREPQRHSAWRRGQCLAQRLAVGDGLDLDDHDDTTTNVNCDIIIPANPLSAQGLATPYQLTGTDGQSPRRPGCTMTNAVNLGAFVQATILDPSTGKLSVYDPLVVTEGTTPAVAPVVPVLPRNAVVTIDFGFNGTDLTQVGATPSALRQGNCVNGQQGSVFGQVSFCNGTNFFNTAFQDEREGKLWCRRRAPRQDRRVRGRAGVGPGLPGRRATSTWWTRTRVTT